MWHRDAVSVNLVFFSLLWRTLFLLSLAQFVGRKAKHNFNVIYGMEINVIAYFAQVVNLSLSLSHSGCLILQIMHN